jgi:acyl-CoA thioesterase
MATETEDYAYSKKKNIDLDDEFAEFELFEEEVDHTADEFDTAVLNTAPKINQAFSGAVEEIKEGYAKTRFMCTDEMVVDRKGLVHTGFIFSAANYAAMVAVNEPTAVLAVAKTNFLAPIKVHDEVIFEASTPHKHSRKRLVTVVGWYHEIKFFEGEFSLVVLEHHPLALKLI